MSSSERFDVDRVQLRHYRSVKQCDIRFGEFTVLIGPNGSGKSNIVDSLRFVAQALDEGLDHALRERGGVAEVRRRSTGHPNHFEIRLECRTEDHGAAYAFRIGAAAGGDYRVTHESCRVAAARVGAEDAHFEVKDGEVVSTSEATLPRTTQDRLLLVQLSGHPGFRPLFDGLTGVNVFNLNPEVMKFPQKPTPGDLLFRDGSNIASVWEVMKRSFPAEKEMVEGYLKAIVPGIESVSRKEISAWETLELRQHVEGAPASWTFPASSMSDGTLRALGVLVALFGSDPGSPSPVAIEEPETALHPAAAQTLLEALLEASQRRQVIVTSHSPDLLDSPVLEAGNLLAVRADQGTSVVNRIDRAGANALRTQLYTAGELLRSDQLLPVVVPQPDQAGLF